LSNAAITWCSNLHPGKGPKGVLFCLADRATDHSGEDWTCFPSIADIMKWTDYSRAAVERNLQLLWREGFISRKRRRRGRGRGLRRPCARLRFAAWTRRHFAAWATPHFRRRHAAK
jgi:DNA-binding IclR family transcriptional regulator